VSYYGDTLKYCDYYTCCGEVPCKKGAHLMKNHDLNLDLPNKKRCIVQFRKSAQATMNAMFRNVVVKKKFKKLDTRFKKGKKDIEQMVVGSPNFWRTRPKNNEHLKGQNDRYAKFIKSRRKYYLNFVKKWITDNKNPNTYYLEYVDFVEKPFEHLSKIIKLFEPKKEVDKSLLKRVIKEKEISLKHDIKKDPLYIENFNEKFNFVDVEERYYK
jgi:hypothetical protein